MFENTSTLSVTEPMLTELRASLADTMSKKRYRHTLAVEEMVLRLGELFVHDEQIMRLRAAALLHDITKEYSVEQQLALCAAYGIRVSSIDMYAPKTFHARTAAAVIPDRYPDFADDTVIKCVRWHTTGHAGMTTCEKLVYLADYIDMSREFEDCVRLRDFFFSADPQMMSRDDRKNHLRETLILSYDMTIQALIREKTPISPDTLAARNELILRREQAGL
ncbi:MAG: HD domain-containing protein [Ruminococcaceae bacterium]|nr:HD domain-containing protein [Oscillospiraceae bacterium]